MSEDCSISVSKSKEGSSFSNSDEGSPPKIPYPRKLNLERVHSVQLETPEEELLGSMSIMQVLQLDAMFPGAGIGDKFLKLAKKFGNEKSKSHE